MGTIRALPDRGCSSRRSDTYCQEELRLDAAGSSLPRINESRAFKHDA